MTWTRISVWAWLIAGVAASCSGATGTTTSLVVTVEVDPLLGLDNVKIVAGAAGRSDVQKDYPSPLPASVRWTVLISNAASAFQAAVTATGQRGGQDIVTYSAFATVTPGQERDVLLKLDSACAGPAAPTCQPSETCDNGVCVTKPVFGNDGGTTPQTCANDGDCGSGGHCSDGLCCDTACQDGCYSCLAADTGGLDGQCLPVKVGESDGTCTRMPEATCKETGACDGQGHCQMQPDTVECIAQSCSGIAYAPPSKCDGSGSCVTSSQQDCGPYTCGADGRCRNSCTLDSDCATHSFCIAGRCVEAVCTVDDWCWHNPHPGLFVNAIWGPAPNDVWAVGDGGGIAHWDGTAWRGSKAITASTLLAIHGAAGVAWAVGTGGTALEWDGRAWHEAQTGVSTDLRGAWVSGSDDAWVAGVAGGVLHWQGGSWQRVPFSDGAPEGSVAVSGRTANDVWVATIDSVYHWDGNALTKDPSLSSQPDFVNHVIVEIFADPEGDTWVVAENDDDCRSVILRGPSNGWSLFGIIDTDRGVHLVKSSSGTIWLANHDAVASSWNPLTDTQPTARTEFPFPTSDILPFSDDDVMVLGGNSNSGSILRALTLQHWDGHSLSETSPSPVDTFSAIATAAQGSQIWIVGRDYSDVGVLYESGGGGWTKLPLPPVKGLRDALVGTTIVGEGPTIGVFSPVDFTWSGILGTTMSDYIYAIDWVPANAWMWSVGTSGRVIYQLGDPSYASGTTSDLFDVVTPTGSDVWAVGLNGTIIHKNGAADFVSVPSGTTASLNGICANGPQDLWVVGDSATALHWTGSSWASADDGLSGNLVKVVCLGSELWAVAEANQIWHYINGAWQLSKESGTSRYSLQSSTADDIATTQNALWVVGQNGTVLKKQR